MNHKARLAKKLKAFSDWYGLLILRWRFVVSLGILGLLLTFLYRSTFAWLLNTWQEDSEFSYGFLVPLISLWLVWIKREQLAGLVKRPSPAFGALVILLSGFLLLAGRAGGFVLAEGISLLFMLPGIVLFLLGWGYLKALALPLAYLNFMVPWMEEIMNHLHRPFQLLSAKLGALLLYNLGIPVFRDGTNIMLPGVSMEVARGCSGVQFLISVIALGIPLVYLTQKTWKRGIIVIASSVAISIPTNGARVALAGIMGHVYGSGSFHGPFHIFQGLFVSYVGLVALFVVNWLVCKIPSRFETKLYNRWKVRLQEAIDPPKETSRRYLFPLVLILLIGIGVYVHLYGFPRPVPPKRVLAEFPMSMDDWGGQNSTWLNGDRFFPGVDNGLTRTYRNASGREINLYIGYLASQRQGKSLISYHANPLREAIRQIPTGLVDLGQGSGPGPQTVNLSFPVIDQTRYAAVFWYRFPSGEFTQRVQTKLKGITDAVIHRRNNGAVILLAARPASKGEEEPVTNDLLTFTRILAPLLREYLP